MDALAAGQGIGVKKQADRIQNTAGGDSPETNHALRRTEQEHLGTVAASRAKFNDLVGTWTHDPEFDEVLASQRRIDTAKWK